MFTVDIPYVSVQDAQTVLVAQAAPVQNTAALPQQVKSKTQGLPQEKVIENCQDVTSLVPSSSFNSLPVLHSVLVSLGYNWKVIESGKVPAAVREAIKVTVEVPLHGTVERFATPLNSYWWQYTPDPGYQGKDRVAFLVEAQGRRFKIVMNLLVHEMVNEFAKTPACLKVFPNGKKTGMYVAPSPEKQRRQV